MHPPRPPADPDPDPDADPDPDVTHRLRVHVRRLKSRKRSSSSPLDLIHLSTQRSRVSSPRASRERAQSPRVRGIAAPAETRHPPFVSDASDASPSSSEKILRARETFERRVLARVKRSIVARVTSSSAARTNRARVAREKVARSTIHHRHRAMIPQRQRASDDAIVARERTVDREDAFDARGVGSRGVRAFTRRDRGDDRVHHDSIRIRFGFV